MLLLKQHVSIEHLASSQKMESRLCCHCCRRIVISPNLCKHRAVEACTSQLLTSAVQLYALCVFVFWKLLTAVGETKISQASCSNGRAE